MKVDLGSTQGGEQNIGATPARASGDANNARGISASKESKNQPPSRAATSNQNFRTLSHREKALNKDSVTS